MSLPSNEWREQPLGPLFVMLSACAHHPSGVNPKFLEQVVRDMNESKLRSATWTDQQPSV